MRTALVILTFITSIALLAGCDGSSSGGSTATQTYTASLTDIQISRTADQQALPVNNLPAAGANIAVR